MKSAIILIATILLSGSIFCQHNSSTFKNQSKMNHPEKAAIESLLKSYEKALNSSDAASVLELYTEDGVFMPSEAPTSVGKEAVEGAYNFVFSQIKLNIEFTIEEIEIEGSLAIARTISKGTVEVLAAGITAPEENRELFVLKKKNGKWKIARYIFNKTAPPSK